jgi:tetratricopeptide (TPR) repeat protein
MLSFGLIVVCLLGYQTNQRVAVWNDTITLFTDAEEKDGRTQIGDLILAKAYAYRAEAALIRGDIGIAIQDLSSAISRHPEYHQAFYRRGTARERLGDHKGALDDYTHAIAMNSAIPAYYNDRGIAKMQIGELDSAVVDYTRAIELDPNMGIAYANRAFVYFKMGKQDECCSDLRRAHSLGYADAAKLIQEHCR